MSTEERAKSFMNKIAQKAHNNESIKKEIGMLQDLHDYLKQTGGTDFVIDQIEDVLPQLQDYQQDYEQKTKEKLTKRKEHKYKLQKEEEYTKMWQEKSLFYKLTHPSMNPSKTKISNLDIDAVDKKIESLKGKKSR